MDIADWKQDPTQPQGVAAIRAKGSNLNDAGIQDGDLVIFRKSRVLEVGAVLALHVVAEEKVILRKIGHDGDNYTLTPEATPEATVTLTGCEFERDELRVIGKVIAVIRHV